MNISAEQHAALRSLARESYGKMRMSNPYLPHADSDEGQRKIDRLYGILCIPFKE